MKFRKNVARPERLARVLGGALLVACGLVGLHASLAGLALAAAGAVAVLTGLLRYCPACDLAGRSSCRD